MNKTYDEFTSHEHSRGHIAIHVPLHEIFQARMGTKQLTYDLITEV
jgi:hypothetical protein